MKPKATEYSLYTSTLWVHWLMVFCIKLEGNWPAHDEVSLYFACTCLLWFMATSKLTYVLDKTNWQKYNWPQCLDGKINWHLSYHLISLMITEQWHFNRCETYAKSTMDTHSIRSICVTLARLMNQIAVFSVHFCLMSCQFEVVLTLSLPRWINNFQCATLLDDECNNFLTDKGPSL